MSDPLVTIFADVLEIDPGTLTDASSPESVPAWDSLAVMDLVGSIEDTFGIELTTGEIMQMRTLGDIRTILRGKGVDGV